MVGEKIVAGTSYWAPIDGANVVNETYAIVESTDGIFSLKKNSGYMASFALQQRYNSNVQLDIVTAQDAQSALYLESTVAVTPSSTSVSNNLRHQSYTLQVGSEITALSIKTVTAGPSTLLIALTGYEGNTGVFKMVNGVEEFTRYTTVYEKVSALVLNDGFDLNVVNQKNDAQIPLSARTSMQAAAAEEPTKNRVFDINLLMENLVARFEEFRSSVKNQVYDLLKYKILFYTRYDLADGAWGLINEFGFGSVERIINWFNTEERKTMLANLITKDPLLKDELGYDNSTGDMNYFAVAKAALLVFAQWLHKTYIATNAGLNALWNAFMGNQTLADLVAGIFTGATDALYTVKHNLQTTWDGIKSAGQFIMNSVIDKIMDGLTFAITSVLDGLLYLVSPYLVESYSSDPRSGVFNMTIGSSLLTLKMRRSHTALQLTDGQDVLLEEDLLRLILPVESLGITEDVVTVLAISNAWYVLLDAILLAFSIASEPTKELALGAALTISMMFQMAFVPIDSKERSSKYSGKDLNKYFLLMSAILLIQSSMVKLAKMILEGKINKVEFINQLIVLGMAVFGVDQSIFLQEAVWSQFLAMAILIIAPAILLRDTSSPSLKSNMEYAYSVLEYGFFLLGFIFKAIGWQV